MCTFEPYEGESGKDVVWFPSSPVLVDRMLDLARVTSNDVVIDLGSGDGRIVVAAAKRGARALGIEYNPDMVELSQYNAEREDMGERAQFMQADLFDADLSQATVIITYLLPALNLKLRPKILGLKPGTRVVCNLFGMGAWAADETACIDARDGYMDSCSAHLWIVPARVEGEWKGSTGDVALVQRFQMISGSLRTNAGLQMLDGKLRGDEISFNAGGAAYTGRVNGLSIDGTVTCGGNASKWTAIRTN